MNLPTNAHEFQNFMHEVWRMDCRPEGEGITLIGSPLYERWHHALHTLQYLGAFRTGATTFNGEYFVVYRFNSDKDLVSVRVKPDGSAFKLSHRKRHIQAPKILAGEDQ